MVWINEISLADIISIIALVATFITVVLIFVQRNDGAKPCVFVKTNSEKNNYSFIRKEFKCDLGTDSIQICCLGNGIAKNISVESYLVLDKTMDFYKTISIKGGLATVKTNKGKLEGCIVVRPNICRFEAMNNNESVTIANVLEPKILTMAFCGSDAISQRNGNLIPWSEPCIILKISYTNIFGKNYVSFFQISLSICMFSEKEIAFFIKNKSIKKKEYKTLLAVYKKQNYCGWFSKEYEPQYK